MANPYAPPSGDRRSPDAAPGDGAPSGPVAGAPADGRPGQPEAPWPSPLGGPGAPQGSAPSGAPGGPTSPRRPEPDPAAVRATTRRVVHFGLLLLAGVLTSTLPLPWRVGSLVFVTAALVVGVRALVLAWRAGIRGGVVPVLGVGVACSALVGLTVLSLMVVWPQQMERQSCQADAITIAAAERCEAEFRRSVEERLQPAGPSTSG